jgi:hypothetical protein
MGTRSGRWDWLEDLKPRSVADTLVAEAAKVVIGALKAWPPSLEWTDAGEMTRFAPLYAAGAPKPSAAVIGEGLRLAMLELDRDVEAIDFFMRNDYATRVCSTANERLALELVWRVATEWMLELGERTQGRLRRPALRHCLERVAAAFPAAPPA